MEFFVRTYREPVSIKIDFETDGSDIFITGSDPSKPNTDYFKTIVDNGIYEFNLPQNPQLLKITVFEEKEGNIPKSGKFSVKVISINKLKKQPLFVDQDTREFIDFSMGFSEKAGYLPIGNYYSKNKKFLIKLLPGIDENRDTPSRVHMYEDYIEVSKKWFDEMTVAGREAILLHEFGHNHLEDPNLEGNNEIEENADEEALKIYLGIGYPKFEWMNSWAYIYDKDNESHIERFINSDINIRNSM